MFDYQRLHMFEPPERTVYGKGFSYWVATDFSGEVHVFGKGQTVHCTTAAFCSKPCHGTFILK